MFSHAISHSAARQATKHSHRDYWNVIRLQLKCQGFSVDSIALSGRGFVESYQVGILLLQKYHLPCLDKIACLKAVEVDAWLRNDCSINFSYQIFPAYSSERTAETLWLPIVPQ